MRFKAIICQVFTREMEDVVSRSPHSIEVENVPMGLHDLGVEMRSHLQERIDAADAAATTPSCWDTRFADGAPKACARERRSSCFRGLHDCIGLLMGSHRAYQAYFEDHPGVYYRSPGWIEFQTPT